MVICGLFWEPHKNLWRTYLGPGNTEIWRIYEKNFFFLNTKKKTPCPSPQQKSVCVGGGGGGGEEDEVEYRAER